MRAVQVRRAAVLTAFLAAATAGARAEQTWIGAVSDSMCGAKHEPPAEGGPPLSDKECTLACVKGGSTFVLVVDGKVLKIANQDHPDLVTYAGEAVKVTGEMKGDAITIAGIEKAAR